VSLKVRFLTATGNAEEVRKTLENVQAVAGVVFVTREFENGDDPVIERIFNATLKKGLKPYEAVNVAADIGSIEGVTHSYLIGARYLL
jgi:hypothetical protein